MTPRELAWMLSAALFGAAISPTACADIYTWTGKDGLVNISNLPPPDGIKPTRVMKELPKPPEEVRVAAIEADRRAEVQMLEGRVRQLEREVDMARNAPPPMAFMPPPQPAPTINYVMNVSTPQQQAPGWNSGYGYGPAYCDTGWPDCNPSFYGGYYGGYYPGFYPTPIVVVSPPFFRNRPPFHNGGNRPTQLPVRAPMRVMR